MRMMMEKSQAACMTRHSVSRPGFSSGRVAVFIMTG